MKRTFFSHALLLLFAVGAAQAQDPGPLEVEREFNVFTAHNAEGYFRPLFTSLQEGFATNLYHTAQYGERWSIALDLSLMGMIIPERHRTFNALLPESYADRSQSQTAESINGVTSRNVSGESLQPTVYGGIASPVFSAPQSEEDPARFSRTVGFAEGNEISLMPALPHLQLMFGFPTRTELRTRIVPIPDGDRCFLYLGFALNQQIDRFFNLFGDDTTTALALNASVHYMDWTEVMSGLGFTGGAHISKRWGRFTLYAGAQLEGMSGEFTAVRETSEPGEVASDRQISPYEEIRKGEPIVFDLKTFNVARLLGGFSFREGGIEFHADAAWASQPVISGGITFRLGSFGGRKQSVDTAAASDSLKVEE